jgi:DNA-binding XRE family transcriptional regulator
MLKPDKRGRLGTRLEVVGSNMNWAVKVSALRTQLRLNQGAFASLIGVSQTYVSRLEAGNIEPSLAIAGAIDRVAANPRTRTVFDDFVSTVRHSPHCSILVDLSGDDAVIRAASRRVHELFPDGEKLSQTQHMDSMKADVHALIGAGLVDGLVASGEALWLDRREHQRHWRLTYVPVRDEVNNWYVHAMLQEIGIHAYQSQLDKTGPDIQITRVATDTP